MNFVITGCSRGIGLEVVKILAQHHNVYCLTRNTHPLSRLNLKNVKTLSFDLEHINESALKEFFEGVEEIHGLLNNAGLLVNKRIEELSLLEIRKSYEVNVFGPMRLIQLLLKPLSKGQAHILNVGSMGGVQGSVKFAGLSAYSSSKGALAVLTECLALELKEKNISVNCVALGAVQTEMLAQAFPGYKAPLTAKEMADYLSLSLQTLHNYQNGQIINLSLSTP